MERAAEDAAGNAFVLRRPPLGHVLESAHDMGREHRIISALADEPVPVPVTIGLCKDAEVNGAPFYVMRFVDGTVLHDADTAPTGGNDDLSLTGHWSWDDPETPGALSFTLEEDGDVIHAQGFMNFDGSFGVFRLWSSQLEGEGGDACIGIALLIREPDRN